MKITQYRTYPYTFCRPNETIRAVIRLYNDMNLTDKVIEALIDEFNVLNEDAKPPSLGQTVQVPVLIAFAFRHENENKIFTDEEKGT